MLDLFVIATTGGIVLWQRKFTSVARNPVNDLLANCIVPGNAPPEGYLTDNLCVKYTLDHQTRLVLVAAYQKVLPLTYVDNLLKKVHAQVLKKYKHALETAYSGSSDDAGDVHAIGIEFDDVFARILRLTEDKADKMSTYGAVNKTRSTLKQSMSNRNTTEDNFDENTTTSISHSDVADEGGENDDIKRNIAALRQRSVGQGRNRKDSKKSNATVEQQKESSNHSIGRKNPKQARKWDDTVLTSKEAESLNYSSSEATNTISSTAVMHLIDKKSMGVKTRDGLYDAQELSEQSSDETSDDEKDTISNTGPTSRLSTLFKHLSGNRVLTQEELDQTMIKTKEHLITKNVAADIADDLTRAISSALVGKKMGGWKTIHQTVRTQMELTLRQILTPKSSIDLLRDILMIRGKRPYTIVFCGVNGVGKSTNLSKVCFWLLQNNLSVLIAACDTFRSGAVEQLKTHVRNLRALVQEMKQRSNDKNDVSIELFEKGYGKDAAGIAKEAVQYASNRNFNIVLIDTAGRMQDNEPLMRSLAKLITLNNPDKIIFVGEALVGNDAVDQVVKFNSAIKDFSGQAQPRQIDGIILTKFDTIADKVGAALSMTYATGQPIYFVGTGQTYTDLKKMNVKSVVRSLLER